MAASQRIATAPKLLASSARQFSSPAPSCRTVSSLSCPRPRLLLEPLQPRGGNCPSFVSRCTRRRYADSARPQQPPAPNPKKRFRFFRWMFRLTLLGAVGGVAALAYPIYLQRFPVDQIEPDPEKKTLVILGTLIDVGSLRAESIPITLRDKHIG